MIGPAGRLATTLLAFAACLPGCTPEAPGTAGVELALDPDLCADFCVQAIAATVARSGEVVPIGPGQMVPCGSPLAFGGIPGGQRVTVQARALGHDGSVLLEGTSEDVTAVADSSVQVPVLLRPTARPSIASASPAANAPTEEGTEVLLTGVGFGDEEGRAGVELDDEEAEVVAGSWTDRAIRLRLRPGSGSTGVRVRNCGVASDPFPLLVLAARPATDVLHMPECPGGLSVRALAALPGTPDLLLAMACQSSGYIQRFLAGSCALSTVAQKALPGLPVALAPEPSGEAAWIALEPPGGLVRAPISSGPGVEAGPTLGDGAIPRALAWAGDSLWVLGDLPEGPRLFRVRQGAATRFDDVPSDLVLVRMASVGGRVLLAARNPDGEGRLVVVLPGTGEVRRIVLPDCAGPIGVAGGDDGTWAAVSCGGATPMLASIRLEDSVVTRTPLPPNRLLSSIEVDRSGSVAFGIDGPGGVLVAADLARATILQSWSLAPAAADPPLVRMPSEDSLVLGGPEAGMLTLFAPYRSTSSCTMEGR